MTETAPPAVPETAPEETPTPAPETAAPEAKEPVPALVASSPKAWLSTLNGSSVRKLAYCALEWAAGTLGIEAPVPGSEKKEVTPTQFVNYLKDGTILAKLANKMQPEAIPEVHEGEEVTEEQKRENLENFKTFAKDKAGVADADLFKTDKVEKGKGFKGLLATLIGLGTKAAEAFKTEGLKLETLLQLGVQTFGKGWVQGLLNRLFRRSQPAVTKAEAAAAEGAPAPPAAAPEEAPAPPPAAPEEQKA